MTPHTLPKIVRDNIPEIVRAAGRRPAVRILSGAEYQKALEEKLAEETGEYERAAKNGTDDIEELADIADVIDALLEHAGVSRSDFEAVRRLKKERNGGFEKRILLERIDEK